MQKNTFHRSALCAALFLASVAPAQAATAVNQLRVQLKGLAVTTAPPAVSIGVSLSTSPLPEATVGAPYLANLKNFLAVTGDPTYAGAGVAWAEVSNSLPAGLLLTSDGLISGTPTVAGTGTLTARATYKGVSGEQAYQVVATAPAKTITQYLGYRAWSDNTVAQSCNEYLQGKAGYTYAGVTGSGVYSVKPAGESAATAVYCDMTTNGGGYTVVASVKGSGSAPVMWAQAVAGSPPNPTQGNASYLPASFAQRLAAVSSSVLIKQANTGNMLYSSDAAVLSNVRQGKIANYSDSAWDQTSLWTQSPGVLTQLNTICAANDASAAGSGAARYPSVFWGCGNVSAMHVTRNISATTGVAGFGNTGGLQMVVMYR